MESVSPTRFDLTRTHCPLHSAIRLKNPTIMSNQIIGWLRKLRTDSKKSVQIVSMSR